MTNRPSNSLHCTALIMMLIVIINYVFTGVKTSISTYTGLRINVSDKILA